MTDFRQVEDWNAARYSQVKTSHLRSGKIDFVCVKARLGIVRGVKNCERINHTVNNRTPIV